MKVDLRRFLFALLDGTAKWVTGACWLLVTALLIVYYDVLMPGGRAKLPILAQVAEAFIPKDSTAIFYLFALPGLIWCAWLKPRTPIGLFTSLYSGVGLICMTLMLPAFMNTRGVLGVIPPPFYHIHSFGEAIYVAFCFLPLMVATVMHFRRPHV